MSPATADQPTPAHDLESTFAQHFGFVRARLRGLGVAPAELDDAAQDVFEVLVRRIADYDPRQSMRGWMAGIARRVASRYRERGQQSQRRVVPLDEARPAGHSSPEERTAQREAWRVLQKFVDTLEPERWSVFVLAEIEGLRGTEIAAELDLNINTVYARLRSARVAFDRTLRRHHAQDRRGLRALVPIWPFAWRGWSRPGWSTGLGASAALGTALSVGLVGARCGSEPAPNEATRSQPEPSSARHEQPIAIPPRPAGPATVSRSAFAPVNRDADHGEWTAAGSGYHTSSNAAGEHYILSHENRYRLDGDRLIFERTYIGDDDFAVDSTAWHISTDGFTVVNGSREWAIAVPAGETRTVLATLQAEREGVVGFSVRSGKPDEPESGGGHQFRFLHEQGLLRRCASNECEAPTASEAPSLLGPTCRHTQTSLPCATMAAATRDELPPRVLSGIQPSGTIHLGNYFGAIQQHVALQDEFPGASYYFIADYHALTTLRDPDALRKHVFDVALTYLACGLDPDKALLFRQSDIPEVTELAWMLSTVTGMGLLERAHSYKDKVAQNIKPVAGLFFYPVLMAADILIYQSSLVPVGKDQVQHVEMTQDMATHFNEGYAKDSPVLRRPEWRLSKAPYVPGLDGRKMSKSYGNTLPLFLSGKKLKKAVGQIVTDSTALGQPLSLTRTIEETIHVKLEGRGEMQAITQAKQVPETVYSLLQMFCDEAELAQVREWYATGKREGQDFGWGHAKQLLASKIDAHFAEARTRREYFLAHPDEVEAILQRSAKVAREVARTTVDACRRACGLA